MREDGFYLNVAKVSDRRYDQENFSAFHYACIYLGNCSTEDAKTKSGEIIAMMGGQGSRKIPGSYIFDIMYWRSYGEKFDLV